MPLDIIIKTKSGDTISYTIPLRIMRSAKTVDPLYGKMEVRADWPWTFPQYELEVPIKWNEIETIEIDPSKRMADINRKDNVYPSESIKYIPKNEE